MTTPGRKAEWATLQQLAIRYQGQVAGQERAALRERISGHIAGVYLRCQGVEPVPGEVGEPGARLVRRDSLLERLIKEELAAHTRRSGGQRLLQAAHGGTDMFAPVAAQVFLEDRQHLARGGTFLTAVLDGYDGSGSLEGFMRVCVRHFLADMANARKPLEREARNPQRRARLQGDAPPVEEAGTGGEDDVQSAQRLAGTDAQRAIDSAEAGGDAWAERLEGVGQWIVSMHDQLSPLELAVLRQLMGSDEAVDGKTLAAQFGCSPSWVSQCRRRLTEKLRDAMRLSGD